jgi:DnaD/phage-associated family protein
MQKFDGFKPGKVRQVKVPAPFFSDLLPLVDDLAELKVVLFSMWAMQQKEGDLRYLRYADFVESPTLMAGLEPLATNDDVEATLDAALDRAVERGALLRVEIAPLGDLEAFYFMNTPVGRAAAEDLQAGNWRPGDADNPVEILPERPNIYHLYEANIGTLTPIIADELKTAEAEFPAFWLEEAVRLAVQHNKRGWKYIRAILDRWDKEGKDRGLTGGSAQPDGQKYVSGKYAAFIDNRPDE